MVTLFCLIGRFHYRTSTHMLVAIDESGNNVMEVDERPEELRSVQFFARF